jgi:hypothetical protein
MHVYKQDSKALSEGGRGEDLIFMQEFVIAIHAFSHWGNKCAKLQLC